MSLESRKRNGFTHIIIMLEKKLWPNFVYIILGFILCLSLWQIVGGPGPPEVPIYFAGTIYTVNTPNTSIFTYPISSLPSTDYNQLININNFSFNILSNVCNDTSPLLLILIHSSPGNIEKRRTIRETWGQGRENIKTVFLIGKVLNQTHQLALEEENRKYDDLAQGNFLDAYRNMTYKHVMAFKYTIYHCSQAKYVLKTDDDVFVNMPKMMDFLTVDLSPYGATNLLLCTLYKNSLALRSYRSKWRVSFSEYPNRVYPNYCPGWALLYSPDVLFALYKEAQKTDYFWIDDVLITGILAERVHLTHTDVEPLVLSKTTIKRIVNGGIKYNNSKSFLYGKPDLTDKEIRALWDFVKGSKIKR